METDDQLFLEFQKGSREPFRELFERYREPLYGFFRRRLDNPARAEELAQECFLALLRNVVRYEPRASFRSYLYGIAVNLISAERRKSGRETPVDGLSEVAAGAANLDAGLWVRGGARAAREGRAGGSDAPRIRTAELRRNRQHIENSNQHGTFTAISRTGRSEGTAQPGAKQRLRSP